MNEQIRRLFEQSFVQDTYVNVGPTGAELGIRFDPEKYSQLLIKECIMLCEKHLVNRPDDPVSNYFDGGLRFCSRTIKEHFGVKE